MGFGQQAGRYTVGVSGLSSEKHIVLTFVLNSPLPVLCMSVRAAARTRMQLVFMPNDYMGFGEAGVI